MDNRELKKIIDEIMAKEPTDLTTIAEKANVGRSNLSTTINAKKKKNIATLTLNKIKKAYPKYFGEDSTSANGIEQMGTPSHLSEHDKYVRLLEEQLQDYKQKVHSALAKIESTASRIDTNLTYAANNVTAGRAEVRAAIDYQVMKDSKGDEKKRGILMEQINKLIHLQLTGGGGVGIGTDRSNGSN